MSRVVKRIRSDEEQGTHVAAALSALGRENDESSNPEKMIILRRVLHQYAEVSDREQQTAEIVAAALHRFQPNQLFTGIGSNIKGSCVGGVAAVFDSGVDGPTVLLRAELDALPIAETNDFAHRSICNGTSHKCGHDGHMSCLLGLASCLSAPVSSINDWLPSMKQCGECSRRTLKRGKVITLFQPAEETGTGADVLLKDTLFRGDPSIGGAAQLKPDYVFAFHNVPGHRRGRIIMRKGAITASVRSMAICFHGKTSHAAEPEMGTNPVFAIAEVIPALEMMSNNDMDRPDFCVITPVHVQVGGSPTAPATAATTEASGADVEGAREYEDAKNTESVAYGVAAGYGELHLTMRTWTEQAMQSLIQRVCDLLDGICQRHQLRYTYSWPEMFVANESTDRCVDIVNDAATALQLERVFCPHPMKWGEDFGRFTAAYAGAFFGIGAGEEHPALHNPDYDFPDELISVGASMFLQILRHEALDMI